VAANYVATIIQFADLPTVQKFRPSNPIGRDKKVAPPSMALEFVCGIVGVESAIIKCQEDRHAILPTAKASDYINGAILLFDPHEMLLKTVPSQRVQRRAGANA
jgi:hypothetical protein